MLAVVTGPSGGDKAAAEQALLDRALTEFAWVFTKSRLWVMDRNFPGVARISRMIKVTHVLIRLKSDITGPQDRGLPARRVLHGRHRRQRPVTCGCGSSSTTSPWTGQDVPEMFCLVTDLHDWHAYPARRAGRARTSGGFCLHSGRPRGSVSRLREQALAVEMSR